MDERASTTLRDPGEKVEESEEPVGKPSTSLAAAADAGAAKAEAVEAALDVPKAGSLPTSFDGERVTLRPIVEGDVDELATIANNENIAKQLRDAFPFPYTRGDATSFVENVVPLFTTCDGAPTIFGIEVSYRFAGVISIDPGSDIHRFEGELGYWLGEDFWGQGLMQEAVLLMLRYARDHLKLLRVFAVVYDRNKASAAVLRKCGFKDEGTLRSSVIKDGTVLDCLLFGISWPPTVARCHPPGETVSRIQRGESVSLGSLDGRSWHPKIRGGDLMKVGGLRVEGPRLTVRQYDLKDTERIAELGNDVEISRWIRNAFPSPYTVDEARRYAGEIAPAATHDGMPCIFCLEVDGQFAGSVSLTIGEDVSRKSAEIGYWLARPQWGNGLAAEAVAQAVSYGFSTWPGLNRIFAVPFADNDRSCRVLLKAGFRLEAVMSHSSFKLSELHHGSTFALLRDDWEKLRGTASPTCE